MFLQKILKQYSIRNCKGKEIQKVSSVSSEPHVHCTLYYITTNRNIRFVNSKTENQKLHNSLNHKLIFNTVSFRTIRIRFKTFTRYKVQNLKVLKGSDRLYKVVELSMQCCGKLLSDSFETY